MPATASTPARPTAPSSGQPEFRVTDALTFLDLVKAAFADNPETYNEFLQTMAAFRCNAIGVSEVAKRVSVLFEDHPHLVVGFSIFMAAGSWLQADPDGRVTLKVSPLYW
ncbi:paired amphipathic helix [Earliella scabrosa]|nr:paired amphipathic helix [Earliella scabrosa]